MYARAVRQFFAWCDDRGTSLEQLQPVVLAAYIESRPGSAPPIKQHLAALRMLFDWLVTGHVLETNPAGSVRGPKLDINELKAKLKRHGHPELGRAIGRAGRVRDQDAV